MVQADYYRARILQKFVKKQVMLVRNVPNLVSKFHRLSIQQKYNLKPNSIICIYGGIITKARKLDPTIIALAEISKLRPIFCMMVGWGAVDDISYYKDLFNSLAFNHKEFSGIISKPLPMNQLMNLYYSSDIGIGTVPNINTSYYYCVPSKVYEYMMAGIPFIASKSPETKRLVKETGAGLLVNPESKEDIISSIQESIVDKNKLKIMGDSGRQWAISKYNWEIESRELLKIIN